MYRVYGAGAGSDTSVLLDLETAARVAVVVWYVNTEKGSLFLSEGYRPTGQENPDRYVTSASKTSLGISTQWYQVGRMDRGQTPSAIIPNSNGSNLSRHSVGRALDSDAPTARDMQLRAEGCAMVGLVFNVASESWHCEPLASPNVDLTSWYEFVRGTVQEKPAEKPKPAPIYPDSHFVAYVDSFGHYLVTALYVRKLSTKGAQIALDKLDSKAVVLPFAEFYELWAEINAATVEDTYLLSKKGLEEFVK